jgi:hypothetical protein
MRRHVPGLRRAAGCFREPPYRMSAVPGDPPPGIAERLEPVRARANLIALLVALWALIAIGAVVACVLGVIRLW